MNFQFRKILFYSAHPKILWFKVRENIRGKYGKKIKSHKLVNLPIVKLRLANNDLCKIKKVLNIYIENPSRMTISPNTMELINSAVDLGTEFYLVYDANDFLIGVIGWQPWRNMIVNLVIDYKSRSKGFALSSVQSLIYLKQKYGIKKFNVQVYRKNWRAQNLIFSLGFVFDEDRKIDENYISLTLNL